MFYTRIPLGSKYLTLNRHNEGSFTSINKRKYQEGVFTGNYFGLDRLNSGAF